MKFLLACVLLATACDHTVAEAADAPIAAFHAEYAVSRNGSDVGRSTLDLHSNGDGTWTLTSKTEGTAGLARLAGIDVVETSHFRWRNRRPEALDYDYVQKSAFKGRHRHADFDWKSNEVRVSEGDRTYRYPTQPGVIDRHTASLAIAADLARGARSLVYQVAVKDRIEPNHYREGAHESTTVPAGRYETIRVDRDDRGHDATSWFARSLDWLPVQIEQTSRKGDKITLRLTSYRRG
ncbi:MAG: DUF3108 domain-containing protein [Rhodanobacteraceae bacterium]